MSTIMEGVPVAQETEVLAKAQRRRGELALNGLREDALLAHALDCPRLAAYLLIARMRWAQSVRAKAQSWEVRDERLDWPDPELTHIRLHRTIYYSLGDAFVSEP